MKGFISSLVALICGAIYYYFVLPPINAASGLFWLGVGIVILIAFFVSCMVAEVIGDDFSLFEIITGGSFVIVCAILIVIAISGTAIFRAKDYQEIMTVEVGNFNEDISELEINQLPILDRASAERLGDRRMGEMVDLVSQFEVSNMYTQINIANKPVRTTPLEYGGFFKWINNKKSGVPGYVNVDMVTQEASLVRLEGEGMKYVPSAYFGSDLNRHLRFTYPNYIFGEFNFEVDDEGKPWYIIPVIKKTISLFGGEDVVGGIILDPVTGDSKYYDVDEIPIWVDRVYPESLVTQQLNWYGSYKEGWINSWLGQKGVLNCTEGYNYIAKDDDIWLYTGYTSVGRDESNVGFMLVNLRTKEAKYYACPGAEEFSAMDSAQGAVANFGYTATFPLLINVNNEPTYLMALKDASSLVKMYALVNVTNYQIVSTGTTLTDTFANYAKALTSLGKNIEASNISQVRGKIIAIEDVVKDGYTYYYLKVDVNDNIYIASISVSDLLPFAAVNDEVLIEYFESSDIFKEVMSFSNK